MVLVLVAGGRRSAAGAMIVGVFDIVIVLPALIDHLVNVFDFLVHVLVIQVTPLDAVVVQQLVAVAVIIVVVGEQRKRRGGGRRWRRAVLRDCGRRR